MGAERLTVLGNFMVNTYSIPESTLCGLKVGLATLTVCYGPRTGYPRQEPD